MADQIAFADRLEEAVARKRSQLVVGLDPRLDLLPMELRGEAVLGRAAAASAVARFCKGIVDAHGGRLWAENRSGGGAVFRFTLPVATPPQTAASLPPGP